jgi:hypothetical protein
MLADPYTGLWADSTSGAYVERPVGGTSLSAPLFAGAVALAQQATGRIRGMTTRRGSGCRMAKGFRGVEVRPDADALQKRRSLSTKDGDHAQSDVASMSVGRVDVRSRHHRGVDVDLHRVGRGGLLDRDAERADGDTVGVVP